MAVWKTIDEFPNYEVSDDGGVRFLGAYRRFGKHPSIWFPPKTLSPCYDPNGYRYVTLGRDDRGRAQHRRVHRLVCGAFIPNPECKGDVNHKNGIRDDNRLENLEWATRSENMFHRTRVLKSGLGEGNGASKITEEVAEAIISSPDTNEALAERFGISNAQVRNVRNGHSWTHIKAQRIHEKTVRGERQGRSKLTDGAVREIRASSESHAALSRKYGVSDTVIIGVRRRTLWTHVT